MSKWFYFIVWGMIVGALISSCIKVNLEAICGWFLAVIYSFPILVYAQWVKPEVITIEIGLHKEEEEEE